METVCINNEEWEELPNKRHFINRNIRGLSLHNNILNYAHAVKYVCKNKQVSPLFVIDGLSTFSFTKKEFVPKTFVVEVRAEGIAYFINDRKTYMEAIKYYNPIQLGSNEINQLLRCRLDHIKNNK